MREMEESDIKKERRTNMKSPKPRSIEHEIYRDANNEKNGKKIKVIWE